MITGEELALIAMKKELKILSKAADKAKKERDEIIGVGGESISIHEEFIKIVKSKDHSKEVIEKLNNLKKRSDQVRKLMKKDLLKIMDKQYDAEFARDALSNEISLMKFRHKARKT